MVVTLATDSERDGFIEELDTILLWASVKIMPPAILMLLNNADSLQDIEDWDNHWEYSQLLPTILTLWEYRHCEHVAPSISIIVLPDDWSKKSLLPWNDGAGTEKLYKKFLFVMDTLIEESGNSCAPALHNIKESLFHSEDATEVP